MSVALVLGVVAFIVTGPRAAAPVAIPTAVATSGATGQKQQAQAVIDVTAHHLGNLRLQIDAQVSPPVSYDPISMGQVVVYTTWPRCRCRIDTARSQWPS